MTAANSAKAPQVGEVVPTSPQTPPPDWAQERDAGHLWSAISGLSAKTGELGSAIGACDKQLGELRSDVKDLDKDIQELKSEQKAVVKSAKVFAWIATPLLALAAFLAPYTWSKAMRPDLEKSIADAVKADIERETAARDKTKTLEQEITTLKAQLQGRAVK